MKVFILLISSLAILSSTSYSQRHCGTMELLRERMEQDSTLKARMDSSELHLHEHIEQNGLVENKQESSLPLIDGYTPTGDPETDLKNWQEAKKALYERDPDLYRKQTRNITPNNQIRK